MESHLVRSWRVQLLTGLVLLALACALGAWVLARGNDPFAIDAWWNGLLPHTETDSVLFDFSLVMNSVGGTWVAIYVIPLGGALALVLLRRPWAAVYFVAASALSAAAVQVLKHAFGRARPDEILIVSDYGSFPSGHTANAATIAVIAALLFPRVWVVIVGAVWIVLMAFSRTYLHAHWLSDTLGGALAGAGVAFTLAAVFSALLAQDRVRIQARRQGAREASLADENPS
ncbi:phosphatase PAP2 family protein [Microbacterium sp. RD1]|uniref:phosphatase PAP2 family protein n=1 Tax=Microbacterium sp. RD1 TaxID=3457313 RepID=UPI003FA5A5C4